MLPTLPPELWLGGFVKHLMRAQPQIPHDIAVDAAQLAWERLSLLPPAQAVQTFLVVVKRLSVL